MPNLVEIRLVISKMKHTYGRTEEHTNPHNYVFILRDFYKESITETGII
jgi:hypothetical protein